MSDQRRIVIWHAPYKPPQTALGTYTREEARSFFTRKGAKFDRVIAELDESGICDAIVGYHVEYQE